MIEDSIRCHLYKICENVLGIEKRSPHALRKTYASILNESEVDSATIVKQMGHTDIAITRRFYIKPRKNTDEIRDKLNGIPELDLSAMVAVD